MADISAACLMTANTGRIGSGKLDDGGYGHVLLAALISISETGA